ncbi:hypothetical protein DFH06DRAFT_1138053 [Mycena polygramma]|nr:hypothetical protein DFH06DRAFT_1138053 [Mycena polygramma]
MASLQLCQLGKTWTIFAPIDRSLGHFRVAKSEEDRQKPQTTFKILLPDGFRLYSAHQIAGFTKVSRTKSTSKVLVADRGRPNGVASHVGKLSADGLTQRNSVCNGLSMCHVWRQKKAIPDEGSLWASSSSCFLLMHSTKEEGLPKKKSGNWRTLKYHSQKIYATSDYSVAPEVWYNAFLRFNIPGAFESLVQTDWLFYEPRGFIPSCLLRSTNFGAAQQSVVLKNKSLRRLEARTQPCGTCGIAFRTPARVSIGCLILSTRGNKTAVTPHNPSAGSRTQSAPEMCSPILSTEGHRVEANRLHAMVFHFLNVRPPALRTEPPGGKETPDPSTLDFG